MAPELRLEGLPETIEAGGDWTALTLVLDNAHGKSDGWSIELAVNTEGGHLYGHVQVQIYVDGAWRDGDVWSDPEMSSLDIVLLEPYSVSAGRTTIPLRIRAGAEAPLVDIDLGPRIGDGHTQSDPRYWEFSEIVAPAGSGEEPGEEPGESEEPGEGPGESGKPVESGKPGGGEDPHEDDQPGGGRPGEGGSGGTGPTTPPVPTPSAATGGRDGTRQDGDVLAETGSAESGLMLGAGGAAIALGAALVVGGRRRLGRRP
ncbi:hypothetical protein [Streptomyces sp. NPDC094049]|uniref:hypothetical protein n=1 Tax=Streptomyces sp. NPDC094049 TaxID=3154987 RepID=UPI00332DE491